jgi:hypothetical protein
MAYLPDNGFETGFAETIASSSGRMAKEPLDLRRPIPGTDRNGEAARTSSRRVLFIRLRTRQKELDGFGDGVLRVPCGHQTSEVSVGGMVSNDESAHDVVNAFAAWPPRAEVCAPHFNEA